MLVVKVDKNWVLPPEQKKQSKTATEKVEAV